ncbi:MAG: DUF6364 family protein [Candidatus Kapabacteria bacterium]|nr:DUF6364 family protein [Candidatus Kapabacteria bacterium]
MNSKLTLSIDESTIEKAKFYAKSKKRSLSDIIENYLKTIIQTENKDLDNLSPIVKSLKGTFKDPGYIDYKAELSKQLNEKYL